jgi:hypothetical protein
MHRQPMDTAMTIAPALEIRKMGRSYAVCAGKSVFRRFRSQAAAIADLQANRALWAYWAGSVGVSVENADWVTINA